MLVLRRKVGESIILDGVISISVLAVEGERVKIGINAPPDVSIVREELLRVLTSDTPKPDTSTAQH
jgi:carbon storage regulator